MSTTEESKSNARRLLVDWANNQDHWVRGLVGEILSCRKPLGEQALEHFYGLLLQEKELVDGQPMAFFEKLDDTAGGGPTEEALVLTSIADVENVNALAREQVIQFNPGLTVLFGENGAGKTGYVRILKMVASVRNAEPVLSNVLKPGNGKPSATISYRLGANSETPIHWNGEQGVRPLTKIDIFDSRGLLLHVDGELAYVYTPGDLALFRIVTQALETTRQRLESDRKKREPQGNPFLQRFSRESPLYSKIESLGPSTNLAELEKLAALSKEDEEQLPILRERVEALKGKATADRLQIVRGELALYRRVKATLETARSFDAPRYVETLSRRDEAQRRHREITEESLRDEKVPQVLGQPWREFVEAAERYIRETEHDHYPDKEDVCVYCRQPLAAAATSLLLKYRAFCNSEYQKKASEATRAAQQLAKDVLGLDITHLEADLTRRQTQLPSAEIPTVLSAALTLANHVASIQGHLRELKLPPEAEILSSLDAALRKPLEDCLRQAEDLEKTMSAELTEREQRLQEELPKLRMLEARMALRELMASIRQYVADAQWSNKAGLVVKRFQGTFKSLTDASKLASEQLLNQDFEERFRENCLALKAPSVTLEFPGKKGEPARRKSLTPRHRLSEILSEGEQKVIALADFLAEATLRQAASPIVFDDPVTSLDYKRLGYVVGRIVDLSRKRQVIVFTHNIWFTMELLAHFEKDKSGCFYYEVSEDGDFSGIVSQGNSPRLDSWKDKSKRINALLQRAKQESAKEVRDAFLEKAYEDLRGACEIVVEQDLLQRVVQSYSPNVMMGKLKDINVTELPSAIEKVNDIFDRCCRFIGSHKQPLETLNVRPSLQGLEDDWKAIQDVHKIFTT